MVSPSGINIKNVHIGFPKLRDKLVLVRMRAAQYLPPGGRGTAKRWMRNGDTLPFAMRSIQTVQTFPMYLFNEMHTDSEHIAVPHPPQCAHWGTFPPGEGIAFRHPSKFQFAIILPETGKHNISKSSPKGIPHLISHILYLISSCSNAPSATGDREGRPYAECSYRRSFFRTDAKTALLTQGGFEQTQEGY